MGWPTTYHSDLSTLACGMDWTTSKLSQISYPVFFLLICIVLPLLFEVFFYWKVFNKVNTVAKNIRFSRVSLNANIAQDVAKRMSSIDNNRQYVDGLKGRVSVTRPTRGPIMTYTNDQNDIDRTHREPQCLSVFKTRASRTPKTSYISLIKTSVPSMKSVEWKVARVIVCTIILSALTWSPYGVTALLIIVTDTVPPETIILVSLLAKVGLIYNPIIYVAFNKKLMGIFQKRLPGKSNKISLVDITGKPQTHPGSSNASGTDTLSISSKLQTISVTPAHSLRRGTSLTSHPISLEPITEISIQPYECSGHMMTSAYTPVNDKNERSISQILANQAQPIPQHALMGRVQVIQAQTHTVMTSRQINNNDNNKSNEVIRGNSPVGSQASQTSQSRQINNDNNTSNVVRGTSLIGSQVSQQSQSTMFSNNDNTRHVVRRGISVNSQTSQQSQSRQANNNDNNRSVMRRGISVNSQTSQQSQSRQTNNNDNYMSDVVRSISISSQTSQQSQSREANNDNTSVVRRGTSANSQSSQHSRGRKMVMLRTMSKYEVRPGMKFTMSAPKRLSRKDIQQ